MSKWTDFRDRALDVLDVGELTEEGKQKLTNWLLETATPLADKATDNIIGQLQKQAKDESFWCKLRDAVILPGVIRGGLYFIKYVLRKTSEMTATPTQTA